jgi:hypothetical protein
MINQGLLNCLITAEALSAQVGEGDTDLLDYAQRVDDWKQSVESVVAQLPKPLRDVDRRGVEQLIQQSEAIVSCLTQLKRLMYAEQQHLIKNNTALSAYMTSTG